MPQQQSGQRRPPPPQPGNTKRTQADHTKSTQGRLAQHNSKVKGATKSAS